MQLNKQSIRSGHSIVSILGMSIPQRRRLLSGLSPWVMDSAKRARLV